MNKPSPAAPPAICAGIDISKDHLDACQQSNGQPGAQQATRRFPNTSDGHQRLLDWLDGSPGKKARIVVESTGRYGLDLTYALHRARGTEVMVANPKALTRGIPRDDFAKAQMRRTKTDAVDAEVIADYATG